MSTSVSAEVSQLENDNQACWQQLDISKRNLDMLVTAAKDSAEELRKFVRMGWTPKTLPALERAIAICENRRLTDRRKRRVRA